LCPAKLGIDGRAGYAGRFYDELGEKFQVDPCHRLVFVTDDWFEIVAAYEYDAYEQKLSVKGEFINTGRLPSLLVLQLCWFLGISSSLYFRNGFCVSFFFEGLTSSL